MTPVQRSYERTHESHNWHKKSSVERKINLQLRMQARVEKQLDMPHLIEMVPVYTKNGTFFLETN